MIAPSPLTATLLQSLTPAPSAGPLSGEAFPGVALPQEPHLVADLPRNLGMPLPSAGRDLPALLDDSSRFALAITARALGVEVSEGMSSGAVSQTAPDAATPRRIAAPTVTATEPADLPESSIALPVPGPAVAKSLRVQTSTGTELATAIIDEQEADIEPATPADAMPAPIAIPLPVPHPVQPVATSETAETRDPAPKIASIRDASGRPAVTLDRPSPLSHTPLPIDASPIKIVPNGVVGDGIRASNASTLSTAEPVSPPALANVPVAAERPAEPLPASRTDMMAPEPEHPAKSALVAAIVSIAVERPKAETSGETSIEIGSGELTRSATPSGASSIGFNFGGQPGILAPTSDPTAQILPMDRSQAAIDRQLDLSTASAWLDDLARDISAAVATREKLSFSLTPEHLGRMDVELSTSDAGVTIGFRSDNADARAIIAQAQPRLADELRNHGIRLADTQIFSGAGQERDGNRSAQHQAERTTIVETAGWMPSETEDEIATAPDGRFA